MVGPRVFGDHFFNFLVMYSFLWPLWGVGMTYSGMLSLASQSITHFPFPVLRIGIIFSDRSKAATEALSATQRPGDPGALWGLYLSAPHTFLFFLHE